MGSKPEKMMHFCIIYWIVEMVRQMVKIQANGPIDLAGLHLLKKMRMKPYGLSAFFIWKYCMQMRVLREPKTMPLCVIQIHFLKM